MFAIDPSFQHGVYIHRIFGSNKKDQTMEIYKSLLALHITAGFTAFTTGIIALVVTKGRKGHNSSGLIFVTAMIVVAISAFAMSLIKLNLFLFMIAGFSLYMAFTGYRFLQLRRMKLAKIASYDWLATGLGLFTLLVSTVIIASDFSSTGQGTLIVYAVFGGIMILMIVEDIRLYLKINTKTKSDFLKLHISRMVGAFIAASTAFLVLNWQSDPVWIAWLLPTFLLSPVIGFHQRKLRKVSDQSNEI
jgi:uncharacterized membrane protein